MSSYEDVKAKAATRASGASASKPGAVAVAAAEASRLDARLAEKRTNNPAPIELLNFERDLIADQSQVRLATARAGDESKPMARETEDRKEEQDSIHSDTMMTAAVVPGAYVESRGPESLEADVALKRRGSADGPATAPGAVAVAAAGGATLSQLEQDVAAKQERQANWSHAVPGGTTVGGSQLSQMEQDVAAKQKGRTAAVAAGAVLGGGTQLSQLEQDIAAKQEGRTGAAVVAPGAIASSPRSGAHTELSALEDAVTRKEQAGVVASSGRAELRSMENAVTQKTVNHGSGPAELGAREREVTQMKSDGPAFHGSNAVADKAGFGRVEPEIISKNDNAAGGKPDGMPIEPEQARSKLNGQMGSGVAADMAPDVEYGVYDPSNEGLAVAMPVIEDEEDTYIPRAWEYDPDAKPPVYRRRRFRLYAFLALFALVAACVGAVIGIVLSGNADDGSGGPMTSPREASIEDRVQRIVGSEDLKQTDSPFEKARIWITHNDTMQINSDSPSFVQRYILAYLYFATTMGGEWLSCNPPIDGAPVFCTYSKLIGINPDRYVKISWTRWLSDRPECSWAGITCDERDQVRAIELSGQGLSGPFPKGIKYLPFLQSIVFFRDKLTGTLPADLVDLKHLINIELHNNDFTGSIPAKWWSARNLGRLNLAANQITGRLPADIQKMEDLRSLYLQDNQLTGPIPTEIGLVSKLNYLFLNKNSFSGPLPSEISNLNSMQLLWLQKNQLTGTLPDNIGKMSNLSNLKLQSNSRLGGPLPDSFYDLSGSLSLIDLRNCQFSGPLDPRIGEFDSLYDLRLTNNKFSGPLPEEINDMDLIGIIELSGNNFTGTIAESSGLCLNRGPVNEGIFVLEADCKDEGDGAKIGCDCCTKCCNADGEDCVVF